MSCRHCNFLNTTRKAAVYAPFLGLNGVIYFNEKVKGDRQSATERMIRLLQKGGNLMYFPEGTWNLSPNLPVLPCYWGIVDIAKKGNAMIILVAAEQYGKHFKINIGANFDMNEYTDGTEEKSRAIRDLRDALATLKYEIWETVCEKREEICEGEWEKYVAARFDEWPHFNSEYIEDLIYRPK